MSTERQYIRHRYDTGANWTAANPVLRAGELGIEANIEALLAEDGSYLLYEDGSLIYLSDPNSLRGKIGNGVTPWAELPYTELGQRPDFEAVTFDQAAGVDVGVGQLAWNADEQTLDLGKGGGVVLQIGSEQLSLCRNSTASEISNGTAVRFAGTLGNSGRLLVAPMVADGTYPGYVFFGVTTEAIAPGEDGFVTTFGKVRQVNTLAFEEGDILWCDPATPGGLVNVEPQAPNLKLPVAAVISKGNNGILMVRSDTGRRLMDLHDVEANGSTADGDVLTYVAANNRWEAKSATEISGSLPTGGVVGNILMKDSSANYDASWVPTLDGGTFN